MELAFGFAFHFQQLGAAKDLCFTICGSQSDARSQEHCVRILAQLSVGWD